MDDQVVVGYVDDDTTIPARIDRRNAHITIDHATRARDCLDRLSSAGYDCLVSAYDLPGIDGLELLETVREEYPTLPFVLCTDGGSEAVASRAVSADVSEYVRADEVSDRAAAVAAAVEERVTEHGRRREPDPGQEYLSLFFEESPLGAVQWDEEFRFERVNAAAEEILGYSEAELQGRSWEIIVAEADRERVAEAVAGLLKNDSGTRVRNRNVRKDGTGITCEWYNRAVTDDDGDVRSIFSKFEDITERRRRKKELRRYETIVEALNDAVYVLNETGRFTYVNDAFVDLVGYDEKTILGSTAQLIKGSEAIERAERNLARLLSTDGPDEVTFELDVRPGEGEPIVCEDHMGVLPYDGETFEGSVGTLRDVTARRERSRELRWLRRVVESAVHAVYVTKPDGTITYVNSAFEELTGYTRAEAIGQTPALLNSGTHDEAYFERLWEAVRSGEVWEEEVVDERKGGGQYVARQYIVPVAGPSGEVERFAAFQVDISNRKERERHLDRLDRMLRHNLRNDLNVIRGHAENIASRGDGEESATAGRVVRKVDEILDMSQKGRTVAAMLSEDRDRRRVDIASTVRDVAERVNSSYPAATVESDTPSRLVAVATRRIELAIEELVTNATVHGDGSDSEVEVRVEAGGDRVRIDVEDGNDPLPETEARLLVDGEEVGPLYHGTGLGLWMVYLVVNRSGGAVTAEKSDRGGNCIRIQLERDDG